MRVIRGLKAAWTVLIGALVLVGCASTGARAPATVSPWEADATFHGAFLAGRYAGARREPELAAAYFDRALAREPNNPIVLGHAFAAALSAGDISRAAQLAERSLAFEPEDRLARLVLAVDAVARERYAEVEPLLAPGGDPSAAGVAGRLLIVWARAGDDDPEGAAIALANAPENSPLVLFDAAHAALLTSAGRDRAAGNAAFQRALGTGVTRVAVTDLYGRWLETTRQSDVARALYASELRRSPENAFTLAGLTRLDAGERPAPGVAAARVGAAHALYAPAVSMAAVSAIELPILYLRLAVHLDPDHALAREALGQLLETVELYDQARRVYLGGAGKSPLGPRLRASAAWMRLQGGDPQGAVRELETAVAAGDGAAAERMLLDAYIAVGRPEGAFDLASRLIDHIVGEPEARHWRLYYARALAAERLDRWEAAEADYRRALILSPDQPSVLNNLGYGLIVRKSDLEEAMSLVSRAVQLNPDSGSILDSYGWALFKVGRYAEAVEQLERAVERSPGSAEVRNHLGDAYWRVGRTLEARFQWRSVLMLSPNADQRAEAEAKLADGLPAEAAPAAGAPPDEVPPAEDPDTTLSPADEDDAQTATEISEAETAAPPDTAPVGDAAAVDADPPRP